MSQKTKHPDLDIGCFIPQGRPFVKMHGLRNDFVIVDARREPYVPGPAEVQHICDRRAGVGADELVIIEPPPRNTADVYAFVRIINPDGSEAEACGNASRCVCWLLMRENDCRELAIQTLGGLLRCRMAGKNQVTVEMGRLKTAWMEIPLDRDRDTLHLGIEAGPLSDPVGMNIGNPHAVFFVENLDEVDLSQWGPTLQTHPLFPKEANIGVAQILNEESMRLSVWERPGALTTSCGTGACAAVGAALRRGLISKRMIRVFMPAGSVLIEIRPDDTAVMTGPTACCYAGWLPKSNRNEQPIELRTIGFQESYTS